MPVYAFKCSECGYDFDELRTIDNRNEPTTCPIDSCKGDADRDLVGSMRPHTDLEYHTPVLSSSLGIHPNQIPEAKRRFPHHEFAPDGRMILRSHDQRKRVLKDLGFFDKDGY